MVCTGFHLRRTFLPKSSMCGAHLCAHSPCPHPIAFPAQPTPPHPRFEIWCPWAPPVADAFIPTAPPALAAVSILSTPWIPRIEERCSWSSTTIQFVNRFNSWIDSTRERFNSCILLCPYDFMCTCILCTSCSASHSRHHKVRSRAKQTLQHSNTYLQRS